MKKEIEWDFFYSAPKREGFKNWKRGFIGSPYLLLPVPVDKILRASDFKKVYSYVVKIVSPGSFKVEDDVGWEICEKQEDAVHIAQNYFYPLPIKVVFDVCINANSVICQGMRDLRSTTICKEIVIADCKYYSDWLYKKAKVL